MAVTLELLDEADWDVFGKPAGGLFIWARPPVRDYARLQRLARRGGIQLSSRTAFSVRNPLKIGCVTLTPTPAGWVSTVPPGRLVTVLAAGSTVFFSAGVAVGGLSGLGESLGDSIAIGIMVGLVAGKAIPSPVPYASRTGCRMRCWKGVTSNRPYSNPVGPSWWMELVARTHPQDLGILLDNKGIAVRTGHHCAQPLMECYKIPGTTRASFAMYNTRAEIDQLITGLNKAIKMLT